MIEVRSIETQQDCLDLLGLAKMSYEELASHLEYDELRALSLALKCANNPDRSRENMWVAYQGHEPVGYFIGNINDYYFSSQLSANQTLWFVKKEFRSTRAPIQLFNAFEEWAVDNGCVEIYAGAWGPNIAAADIVNKIYPRMGYTLSGAFYIKQVNNEEV